MNIHLQYTFIGGARKDDDGTRCEGGERERYNDRCHQFHQAVFLHYG
jgi:hypothetical protein